MVPSALAAQWSDKTPGQPGNRENLLGELKFPLGLVGSDVTEKVIHVGAAEVAQGLRALAALLEILSLVLSAHFGQLTTL